MKQLGATGVVIVGFLFLYLALTGKLDCFYQFVSCVTGSGTDSNAAPGAGAPVVFKLPTLPTIPPITTAAFTR